jgi:hypothetical protein
MVDSTIFTGEDIVEVSHYLQSNIQASILNQLLVLTDVPIDKVRVFVAVYRLVLSASNYTSNPELKKKLNDLINEVTPVYQSVFPRLTKYQTSSVDYGKKRLFNSILNEFLDEKNITKINSFIDIFFLFAEKQQRFDINKITGIDLDTQDGKKVYADILSQENN